MEEKLNEEQIRDAEILAQVVSQENTKDQTKSRILVLMAGAFRSGVEAGAAAAGFDIETAAAAK